MLPNCDSLGPGSVKMLTELRVCKAVSASMFKAEFNNIVVNYSLKVLRVM